MPIFASKAPAIRAWKNTGFPVAAGESLRLLWDCDDFRWSEVIVETPDGRLLQQPVGDQDNVVILDVELTPAPRAWRSHCRVVFRACSGSCC